MLRPPDWTAGAGWALRARTRRTASMAMNVRSTMPALKIIASPTRNPIFRNGSFSRSTPMERRYGVIR